MLHNSAAVSSALIILLLQSVSVGESDQDGLPSCGLNSLSDLCHMVGHELTQEGRNAIFTQFPGNSASLLELTQAASSAGLNLLAVAASLDDLLDNAACPAIIHLNDPGHYLVLIQASAAWVQVLDSGRVIVLPRDHVAGRFSGHALVLERLLSEAKTGPKLRLDEFQTLLPAASVGQAFEHRFPVCNEGKEDLTVRVQERDCSSAPAGTVGEEVLAPGESTDVTIRFTVTHGGPLTKSLALLTTDPRQPITYLTVHGEVAYPLRVRPESLSIEAQKHQYVVRTLIITAPIGVEITDVSTQRQELSIASSELDIQGVTPRFWRLVLTLEPDHFVGEFRDTIAICTTDKERSLITVPVAVSVLGDLGMNPSSVFFGFVKPGAEAQQTVTIESRSFAPFAVKSVTSDAPRITAGTPANNDGVWSIPVSVDTTAEGVVEGSLTVTTDVPGEEKLEIPVYAHIIEEQ